VSSDYLSTKEIADHKRSKKQYRVDGAQSVRAFDDGQSAPPHLKSIIDER